MERASGNYAFVRRAIEICERVLIICSPKLRFFDGFRDFWPIFVIMSFQIVEQQNLAVQPTLV